MAEITRQVDDTVTFTDDADAVGGERESVVSDSITLTDSVEADLIRAPSAFSVHVIGATGANKAYLYSTDGVSFSVPTSAGTSNRVAMHGNSKGMLLCGGNNPPVTYWDGSEWLDDGWVIATAQTTHATVVGEDDIAFCVRGSYPWNLWRRSAGALGSGVWVDYTSGKPAGTSDVALAAHCGIEDNSCWVSTGHITTSFIAKLVRWKDGSWAESHPSASDFDSAAGYGYPDYGALWHSWYDLSIIEDPDYGGNCVFVSGRRDGKYVVCLRRGNGDWSKIYDPGVSGTLYGIWAGALDNAYAVGTSGKVVHWDGATWSDITNPGYYDELRGIYGNDNGIWVSGANGRLMSYNGSWNVLSSGLPTSTLYEVWLDAPIREVSDTVAFEDSASALIGAYPQVHPTDPTVSQVNVSKTNNIEMDITCNGTIADGWKVWVKIGDDSNYELAFEHNGTPDFQPNWDGSQSALSAISGGYHLKLDYTGSFPWFTTIYVKVSVFDVLDHAGVLVN